MTYTQLLDAIAKAKRLQSERVQLQHKWEAAEDFEKQRLQWEISEINMLMSEEIE